MQTEIRSIDTGDIIFTTKGLLRKADLSDRNLTRANLTDANLTDANLTDANLTDANLERANLTGANLTRANLMGAILDGTILDREIWSPPLINAWQGACDENRKRMVEAVREGFALHRTWSRETLMCPIGYLLSQRGDQDNFTRAWDTYALSNEAVLKALKETDPQGFQRAS